MNSQHLAFVNHYLEFSNKEKAYGFAYPNTKESSRQNAANRLLQKPEIKEYIDRRNALIDAEANKRIAAKRAQQMLDIEEAKELLTGIIRGQHITYRNARVKHGFEKIEVYPTHPQILRALNMYLKLAGLMPESGKGSGRAKEKKEEEEEEEEFDNYWITIGDQPFDPVEGTKYAQWYPLYYAGILWNPTKPNERAGWLKYMNTLSEEERAPFLENVRKFDENPQQKTTNGSYSPFEGGAAGGGMSTRDGTLNTSVTSPAQAQGHCTPPSEGGFAEQQQKTTTSLTANCQSPTANCESEYISVEEALAISQKNRNPEDGSVFIVQRNMLNMLARLKKPLRPNHQRMLYDVGWEMHPTDPTKVKPCPITLGTITEPPPPKPYVMPKRRWRPDGTYS